MVTRHTLTPPAALVILVLALIVPHQQALAAPQPPTAQPHVVGSSPAGQKTSAAPSDQAPNFVYNISLSASNYYPYVGQTIRLTAVTNRDVGPTPYNIEFYQQGYGQLAYCTYGSVCVLRVYFTSPGYANIQARVAYPNGTGIRALSNTVTIRVHY